jgi:glyoxylase-like metal-dependent hydrolase (beta-lactamase superfamily II)/rhodanese-related sulfurtransferase
MIVRSFFIPGIAHRSYLIGGIGSCFIIDPARDISPYILAAEEEGMQITGILQTHLHADFVSGHCDLSDRTGAPVYVPERAGCLFRHVPVSHGTIITLDDIRIEVRETPGHTPEHVSYVITHLSRGDSPVAVFCGDTLFVGDVGRPDLFPGRAAELAGALFTSLHEQLLTLPDYCEVYPAHGMGSLCGRLISSKPSSTIGYEREYNLPLTITDRDEFIRHLTTNMPPAPDHFHRCSEINRTGPRSLDELTGPEPMNPGQVRKCLDKGCELVDIRRYDSFGGMHIPGSLNIDFEVNFSTFAGWILSPEKTQILVAQNPEQAIAAALLMRRVGIDAIAGYLAGGAQAWALSGLELGHCLICSASELADRMAADQEMLVVDVRTPGEYAGAHIQGSIHIPWHELRTRHNELDKNRRIVLVCGTGVRAGIAASILRKNGFSDIIILAGGFSGWMGSGRE